MTHPLRIGLIGIGHHGLRYARHLTADVPGAVLAAVCRRDIEAGRAWARERGVTFHPDAEALARDPNIDAVAIVTPTTAHREGALAAIRAGKPVLIEKPLAESVAAAEEIARAAEAAGVPCMVAHTLRREPMFEALRERLQGAEGAVRFNYFLLMDSNSEILRAARIDAGFAPRLMELGVHILDWLADLTRMTAARVVCRLDAPRPRETRFRILLAATGLEATLDVGQEPGVRHERITASTAVGTWTGERFAHRLSRWSPAGPAEEPLAPPRATVAVLLREFVECVRSGRPPTIPLREGMRALRLAEACYRSADLASAPVDCPL